MAKLIYCGVINDNEFSINILDWSKHLWAPGYHWAGSRRNIHHQWTTKYH